MKAALALWLVAIVATAIAAPGLRAAETADPDWPCIQRRTGAMSAGVMWPRPLPEEPASGAAADLAATLALRRVGLDEAEALVAAFADTHPDVGSGDAGAIFRAAFERIDRDRERVLSGIARYSRSQVALAAKIDAAHAEIARLGAAKAPEFDRIDALEEQIDWDERIYRDRERSLSYVCETPVLLEKRAYAVAQILMKYLPE